MARWITGAEGAFSFTSGTSITNVSVFETNYQMEVSGPFNVTPYGYLMTKHTFGVVKAARGTFRANKLDTGVQAIPTGTVGTMVITEKSGNTYTFKASVWTFASSSNAPSDSPQVNTYEFVANAESASDTIA